MSDSFPLDDRRGRLRLLEAELTRIGQKRSASSSPTLAAVIAAFRVVVEKHRTIETKVRAELERAKSDFAELLTKIPAIVGQMVTLREEQIAQERAEETLMTPDEEAKMWRDDARRTSNDLSLLQRRLSMLEREARVLKKTVENQRRELVVAVTTRDRAVTAAESLTRQQATLEQRWKLELTARERLAERIRQSEKLANDLELTRSDLELTRSERDVLVAENERLRTMLSDRGVSPTAFE